MNLPEKIIGSLAIAASAAVWFLLAWTAAHAHSWYPLECCHQNDCAEISDDNVRIGQGGYIVIVPPGSHPMWPASRPQPLQVSIPYTKAKQSPDGKYHICLNPSGGLLCFFASIGSF